MCVISFFQFEQENQRLVGEMNNLVDEVRYYFLLLDRWLRRPLPQPGELPPDREFAAVHPAA